MPRSQEYRSRPRVGVDAHRLVAEPRTSGAVYLRAFLEGCLELPADNCPLLYLYVPWQPRPGELDETVRGHPAFRFRFPRLRLDPARSYKEQFLWNQLVLPAMAHPDHLDLFFCPFHLTPLLLPRIPVVTTIHDLCFLLDDHVFALGALLRRFELCTARLRASRFLAVSDFTARHIQQFFPRMARKTLRLHIGLKCPTLGGSGPETADRPYLLWIGRNDPRKNPQLVLAGFQRYLETGASRQETLVLVVPGREAAYFQKLAATYRLGPRARVVSDLTEAAKWSLLQKASALLFPSFCEGFGLPVLEAMYAGCIPIVYEKGPCRELLPPGIPLLAELSADSVCRLTRWVGGLAPPERAELCRRLQERAKSFDPVAMAIGMLAVFGQLTGDPP